MIGLATSREIGMWTSRAEGQLQRLYTAQGLDRGHLSQVQNDLQQALDLIGSEPTWAGVTDVLRGVQSWAATTTPHPKYVMKSSWTQRLALEEARLEMDRLAAGIKGRDDAVSRANKLFATDPATWTPDDIDSARIIFESLEFHDRPKLPDRLIAGGAALDVDVPMWLQRLATPTERADALELLRGVGRHVRRLNDPATTQETMRQEIVASLDRGLKDGWNDPALLANLRELLLETPTSFIGDSMLIGRLPLDELKFAWTKPTAPSHMDHLARVVRRTLTSDVSPTAATEQLRAIVARDPSTWSIEDLQTIQMLFALPHQLSPYANEAQGGAWIGQLPNVRDDARRYFKNIVVEAVGKGGIRPDDLPIFRRHARALTATFDRKASKERTAAQLAELFARDPSSLRPEDIERIQTLALDIPSRLSPDGPLFLKKGGMLEDVLNGMVDGPLPADKEHARKRFWTAWKLALDSDTPAEVVHARFDSIMDRDPHTWTNDEASYVSALASYHRSDLRTGWMGYPRVADGFIDFEANRTISPLMRMSLELNRADRNPSHLNTLAARIDEGETLDAVIGPFPNAGSDIENQDHLNLLGRLLKLDREWSLQGATQFGPVLERKLGYESIRTNAVHAIGDAIEREAPPEANALKLEARRLRERYDNLVAGKPEADQGEGYSNFGEIAELGQLKAKAELILLMKQFGAAPSV